MAEQLNPAEVNYSKLKYGYNPASTLDDISKYFNVPRLPDYQNIPATFMGHIIMTRPSLNIPYQTINGKLYNNGDEIVGNNYNALFKIAELNRYAKDTVMYSFVSQLSDFASNSYLPLVYNRAKTYNTIESELNLVDSNATFFGHTIKYGLRSEDHKKARQLSIDFRNDRFMSAFHLFTFWQLYVKYISNTDYITPNPLNSAFGILDYYGALYYIVTKIDSKEIIYCEKNFIFPSRVSSASLFDFNDNIIGPSDTITVDFQSTLANNPNDPEILEDLNYLTFNNYEDMNMSTYNGTKGSMSRDDYFNPKNSLTYRYPFATSENRPDGSIKNYLYWK